MHGGLGEYHCKESPLQNSYLRLHFFRSFGKSATTCFHFLGRIRFPGNRKDGLKQIPDCCSSRSSSNHHRHFYTNHFSSLPPKHILCWGCFWKWPIQFGHNFLLAILLLHLAFSRSYHHRRSCKVRYQIRHCSSSMVFFCAATSLQTACLGWTDP